MFVEYVYREDHDSFLSFTEDRRAFVSIGDQIRTFAVLTTDPATISPEGARLVILDAMNRAWQSNGNLFREVHPPRKVVAIEEGSMVNDLTWADRQRLRAIIRKNHKRYFADHPTDAQCDNLIDSIGIKVALDNLEKYKAMGKVA